MSVRSETRAARAHARRSSVPRPTSCGWSSPPGWLLVILVVERVFGNALVGFASDLLRGLDAVPQWMVDAVVVGTRILAVVVLGGLLTWALYRRRWRMLGTVALAGLVAAALVTLLESGIETEQGAGARRSRHRSRCPDGGRVPVDRRHRGGRRGAHRRRAVARPSGAPGRMGADAGPDGDRLRGLADVVRRDAGRGRRMARPAPPSWWPSAHPHAGRAGRPSSTGSPPSGSPLRQLDRGGVDARGSTPYFGVEADGSKLFVKALGADERSADLLFRLYRRLLPRDFGDERAFPSLQRAVEHEAFVALAAQAVGVRTPGLRAVATAEPNGYVLAYEAIDGKSLDRVDPSEVTDEVLADDLAPRGRAAAAPDRPSRPPAWRTSSSTTAVRCGSSTSASAKWSPRTCCWPPTSPSCSPRRACASARSGPSPMPPAPSTRRRCRGHSIGSTRGHSAGRHARRSRPSRVCSTIYAALRTSTGRSTCCCRRNARRRPTMNLWWLIRRAAPG